MVRDKKLKNKTIINLITWGEAFPHEVLIWANFLSVFYRLSHVCRHRSNSICIFRNIIAFFVFLLCSFFNATALLCYSNRFLSLSLSLSWCEILNITLNYTHIIKIITSYDFISTILQVLFQCAFKHNWQLSCEKKSHLIEYEGWLLTFFASSSLFNNLIYCVFKFTNFVCTRVILIITILS